jgi:hypothetical protein
MSRVIWSQPGPLLSASQRRAAAGLNRLRKAARTRGSRPAVHRVANRRDRTSCSAPATSLAVPSESDAVGCSSPGRHRDRPQPRADLLDRREDAHPPSVPLVVTRNAHLRSLRQSPSEPYGRRADTPGATTHTGSTELLNTTQSPSKYVAGAAHAAARPSRRPCRDQVVNARRQDSRSRGRAPAAPAPARSSNAVCAMDAAGAPWLTSARTGASSSPNWMSTDLVWHPQSSRRIPWWPYCS